MYSTIINKLKLHDENETISVVFFKNYIYVVPLINFNKRRMTMFVENMTISLGMLVISSYI